VASKVPTDFGTLLNEWDPADLMASVADGAAVSSWTDTTGSVALSQGTGGNQPLLRYSVANFGGEPGVDVDGTDDFMTGTIVNDNQATSWMLVFDDDDTSGSGQIMQCSQQIGFFSGTGPPLAAWAGGSNLNTTFERDPGAMFAVVVYNGASSAIYWRRIDAGPGAPSSVTGNCGSNGSGTSLRIGTHSSGSWSPFDGRYGWIARFNAALSSTDAQDLFDGVYTRYSRRSKPVRTTQGVQRASSW
jgi:hypothetical protein